MATEIATDLDESYEGDSSDDMEPPTERWAPLGAAASLPSLAAIDSSHISELERLRLLEEEQDQLNSSLLALTTHFAQVQFRLKQIVEAETDEKEQLLKELEEFAFKGIPDVSAVRAVTREEAENLNEDECSARITVQREKQLELIVQLKSQLEDLETYAYETGSSELPTSKVMEKQHAIIDQLKHNLNLNLDNFDHLSVEELRVVVDHAIRQIVNPAKVKEKLVEQLKTQVTDLERFISFLQGEAQSPGPLGNRCTCPVHGPLGDSTGKETNKSSAKDTAEAKKNKEHTLTMLRQTLAMLQMVLVSQLGCGTRDFQKNLLKKTAKGNHWGDLRAELEVSIDKVIQIAQNESLSRGEESDYTSDTDDAPIIQCNRELVTAVRKGLAMSLCKLLQHGLVEVGQGNSVVSFGCFPNRSAQTVKMMHAWQLFLKYYEMKHGEEFTELPARKLSQSFSLDIVGGKAITAKQTLLSAIEEILTTHKPLKRSDDSMFKAFVCLGLNQKRLVGWLRIILRTSQMIEYYYQPWSYVVSTGFNDALSSLDRLSKVNFHLPIDLAIRPFHSIKDAF